MCGGIGGGEVETVFVIRLVLTDSIIEQRVVVLVHCHCEVCRSGTAVGIGNGIGEVENFRSIMEFAPV